MFTSANQKLIMVFIIKKHLISYNKYCSYTHKKAKIIENHLEQGLNDESVEEEKVHLLWPPERRKKTRESTPTGY